MGLYHALLRGTDGPHNAIKWNIVNISKELYYFGVEYDSELAIFVYSPFCTLLRYTCIKENNDDLGSLALHDLFDLLSNQFNDFIINSQENKVLRIKSKPEISPISIDLGFHGESVEGDDYNEILKSLSIWQLKSTITLNAMIEDLQKMLFQKDTAIEFLGFTAKEYGGSGLIRRWAPEGSRNYDSLTKFNPTQWKKEWINSFNLQAPDKVASSLSININTINVTARCGSDGSNTDVNGQDQIEDQYPEFVEKREEHDSFLAELSDSGI
ncbi:HCL029Wp [Eremothecium sinecaudum]|uniref:HCL029Wp n=1 Tax=Eremothecium sinecaudum TaxID=45286 RepID=A0A0X8HRH9_9SACH|nr:HCL029Wp [Eremothecium sinecaudum]AMD20122.1 HCL029Wp [Eremothecium sinecaudum]